MSYCIYLRKSRADIDLEARGEMETLAKHEKALLDLAKNMRLPIIEIYKEIVSGETLSARPIAQRLLEEVEQGKWEGVLVMEVERLARGDTVDQGVIARTFKLTETKIITPSKTYDPSNEFDEEYFEFGLFMSRREYKTINRRIQRGRVAAIKEGKFISSTPPYGYDRVKIKDGSGYTLKPNDTEAEVVKLIYKMYIEGKGMTLIARELDRLHIQTRSGNGTWNRSSIGDMLKNPVYLGKIRWSYRPEKKYSENGEVKTKQVKSDDYIIVDGLHPALIKQEDFEKVASIRKRNTKKTTKAGLTLKNPLAGLIYCKKCGQMMTRGSIGKRNPHATIHCPNRYCNNVSAPMFLVEAKIVEFLQTWLIEYGIEMKSQAPGKTNNNKLLEKTIKDLKNELKQIEAQLSNTYDLLEQGVYTVEVFTNRNKELTARKEDAAKALLRLEKELEQNKLLKNTATRSIPKAKKALDKYIALEDAESKNEILQAMVEKIEYLKETPNTRGKLLNDNFELDIEPRLDASLL